MKEAIFDDRAGRRVYGWRKVAHGPELFPTRMSLDPVFIARRLGEVLIEEGRGTDHVKAALRCLDEAAKADNAPDLAKRTPYFCSGCPHNSSTKLPRDRALMPGSVAIIWCSGWIAIRSASPRWGVRVRTGWVKRRFRRVTMCSRILATAPTIIPACRQFAQLWSAGTTMTYKILFNDAVAMTGGQGNDGGLTADRVARELLAMGVRNLAVVYDEKEEPRRADFPLGSAGMNAAEMPEVQRAFSKYKGVSAIIYVQTCAAEKRRRRKRGLFPDPDKRVFINTDVCEGCGDCGVQSNCVSLVPVETELGRKRAVDQSSCNKDYSCLNGFCPSFVTVEGGTPRRRRPANWTLPACRTRRCP